MVVINSVWHDPRVRREATSCSNSGLDTWVIGFKDEFYNKEKVESLPFNTVLIEMEEQYFRPHKTIFSKLKWLFLMYKRLVQKCVDVCPDVIHANDLSALPIAYFAAKRTGSKIVYDSHELFTEDDTVCGGFWRKLFWKNVEMFLIKRVDKVVSVSNASATELATMYRIEKPMVVTNCAFKLDSRYLKPKVEDSFEILYHGKFYKGRGYESFIKSALFLMDYPDVKLVLRGYGIIEDELRDLCRTYNLQSKVRFDLPVEVTELTATASSSHIGVVIAEPVSKNFINTVSNKLFEYLNAGLPVILSDGPEHNYLNEKFNFGIVLKDNTPQCIAEAILQLYNDKALYEELVINVKRTVEVLNWDTEVIKLINLYKDLSCKNTVLENG